MSIYIMAAVLRAGGMTPYEKLVALALADHTHEDGGGAWPSVATTARETALSERTVQRTLKALTEKKIIEIEKKATPRRPTTYRFRMTEDGRSLAWGDCESPPRGDRGGVQGRPVVTLNVKEPSLETSTERRQEISVPAPPGFADNIRRMKRSANGK